MHTIYKYPLAIADEQWVRMPEGAQLLCVQVQPTPNHYGAPTPCVWARVDTDRESVGRRLILHGTGHDVQRSDHCPYIGTFQLHNGGLIFHLFDAGER